MLIQRLDDDMHMVRHDAPGKDPIALAIEMQDRVLDQLCDLWMPQPAGTQASIKSSIGLGQIVGQPGKRFRDMSGQAVGQAKRDELCGLCRIEMR